jgi:hypothetical protein
VYPTARTRTLIAIAPSQLPGLKEHFGHEPLLLPTNKRLLREMTRRYPLPVTCPWTPVQILDPDFWPDEPAPGGEDEA